MAGDEHLLAAIEAVHAAGLDAERWPQALAAVARAVEGVGASLETFDRAPLAPRELYTFGMPPAAQLEYFNHDAAINPRWALITRQKAGELGWDYRILDQAAIKRSPFYMEFLKTIDFPFFVYGMVAANDKEFAGIAVHRSRRQGHVERAGIVRLERLLPHARQAFDVARRLKGLGEARHSLERALDWLADGVVLVRADGAITYANLSFQVIARGKDGIGTWKGVVELSSAGARDRFAAALQAVGRLRDGDVRAAAVDFPVARPSGAPAYPSRFARCSTRAARAAWKTSSPSSSSATRSVATSRPPASCATYSG